MSREQEFFLIDCIRKVRGDITHIGYRSIDVTFDDHHNITQVENHDEHYMISAAETIRAIREQGWQFYVYAGDRLTPVEATERSGRIFLRTTPDDTILNNLDNLPLCDQT